MNRMTIVIAAASATLLALSAGTASAEVRNFDHVGDTRTEACSKAKGAAESWMRAGTRYRLDRFGACECSQERYSDGTPGIWRCNVDAYYTRPH
ncbi:hypothetical protein [uncultured Brevundimonas sp.]|uniref:hypothetical protein n=1 Tax=uncultured Brevundimonas sp. TaxID=213418 RepID=UPI0030EBD449|tara:strand:- start:51893 stop:52174 length:282 start_codon:yes stop_codon:yes gene_type:complete